MKDEPAPRTERRPVVVGIDGSDRSKEALAWAARAAALASAPLLVITAWHYPTNFGWSPPFPEDWDPAANARTLLDDEVKEVLGSDPGVEISTSVIEGPPARVLTDASRSASLIVVSSRGRGEFAGMLLGSVSEYLTAHAHCPVVVVRDGTEDDERP